MTDKIDDIVIPILRTLQKEMSALREKVDSGFTETNARLVAMDGHMASFHTTQAAQSGGLAELQIRVDRLEKRLGLFDPTLDDSTE